MALATLSALTWTAALVPLTAVVLLGAPGAAESLADPAVVGATLASLQAAGLVLAAGWPIGVIAAFGLWGARPVLRRIVLGAAVLGVLLSVALSATDLDGRSTALPALLPPVAGAASLILLILTGSLNTIDPRLLRTSQALGASPVRAWLAVFATLGTPLMLGAAASFALGLAMCTRMPGGPTLAGLVRQAVRQAGVETAPEALLLALLSLAPLVLVGLLLLPGRALRKS